MRKVFVVIGTTGEYSDRSEWLVAAYLSESAAAERVARCDRAAAALATKYQSSWGYTETFQEECKANVEDPHIDIDYTGTTYRMEEVDLVEEIS